MKTTLNFPDDLISRAKIKAAMEHTTLTRLIMEGLKMRLQRGSHDRQLPVSGAEGNLIPGALPAALAIRHDCRFATADRDFYNYPGLQVELIV